MHLNAGNLTRVEPKSGMLAQLAGTAQHAVTLEFAGRVAEVRFSSSEAAGRYRRRYRHLASVRPPNIVVYAAARRPDEIYFWAEGGSPSLWNHSALNAAGVAFLADAVATTVFFTASEELMALHAATVSDGAATAAILGSSTAGKTTTGIACARRGLALYSDEFCLLAPDGVVPFPRALNVRGQAIALLRGDPAPRSPVDAWLQACGSEDCEDVSYDELFGGAPAPQSLPLRAAFAVSARGSKPSARRITPGQMLPHAAAWAKMHERGVRAVERILETLQGVACYDLVLGSPDDTARLIAHTLSPSAGASGHLVTTPA